MIRVITNRKSTKSLENLRSKREKNEEEKKTMLMTRNTNKNRRDITMKNE